jgi:Flp pilus assembly pilin Flp
MKSIRQQLYRLALEESGQDLLEYAFVVGLIALAAIAALTNLSQGIVSLLSAVSNKLAHII